MMIVAARWTVEGGAAKMDITQGWCRNKCDKQSLLVYCEEETLVRSGSKVSRELDLF